MNKFKSLSKKEKAEYIAIIALYPLFMLFSGLGKTLKLFGTKKRQIIASVLSFTIILGMIPVVSQTASAQTKSDTKAVSAFNKAYIPSYSNGTVDVVNLTDNTIEKDKIKAGNNPYNAAISPDQTKVIVSDLSSYWISIIDTATDTVIKQLDVGDSSLGACYNSDGTKAYVAHGNDNFITVIDMVNLKKLSSIDIGGETKTLVCSGTKIYGVMEGASKVAVIDVATDTLLKTIDLPAPSCLALTPDGKKLLVGGKEPGKSKIYVVDVNSDTTTSEIPLSLKASSIEVTPDGKYAYVAYPDASAVAVVDLQTGKVTTEISVGNRPCAVGIKQDGTTAYSVNYMSNTISVIDIATNTVTQTIETSNRPYVIGIFMATVFVSTGGGQAPKHTVTINGGDSGTLYKGETVVNGNSATLTVKDGTILADAMIAEGYSVKAKTGYKIKELEMKIGGKIKDVAGGSSHTVILGENGEVFAFGLNKYGQLGNATNNGNDTANPTPTKMTGSFGKIKAIAAGGDHTLLLDENGEVFAFGLNKYGQLGNATNNGNGTANPTPTKITGSFGKIKAITAGGNHTVLLDENGEVFAFGYNRYGQLGNTTNNGNGKANPMPTKVTGSFGKVTAIATGGSHSVLLDENGKVFAFGDNYYGQLGNTTNNGNGTANPTPTQVTGSFSKVTAIATGGDHTLLLDENREVFAFGLNVYGQLGNTTNNENSTANPTPTQVTGSFGKVTAIATGGYHTLLLDENKEVFAFGLNDYGQLGNTTNNGRKIANPTPAQVTGSFGKVTAIATGGNHTVLLDENGEVFVFGNNYNGQLGLDEGSGYNPTPTKLNSLYPTITAPSFADITVTEDIIITVKYQKLTTLSLTADKASGSYGTDVTLTATIADVDSLLDKAVKFYDGESYLGSATTNGNGVASYTVSAPAAGIHSYKAEFEADGINTAAQSNVISYTVSKADQNALSFGGYNTAATYGDSFKITATGGSGTGALTYKSSNTSVATVNDSGNVTIIGVGDFTITATKASDNNYNVQTAITNTIKVSPKTLTITGISATNRQYDGTKNVALTGGTLNGKVLNDDVTVTRPTSGTIADKNVGNGKAVTITKPTITGAKANCYALSSITGITVNITAKPVTIIAITVNDKTYNGTKTATLKSGGTLNGAIIGDTVTVQAGTITFNSANASNSASLTATGFAVIGADKDNYILQNQPTVNNAKIEKATLTASIDKVAIKAGAKVPTLTVKVSGFVNGEGEGLSGFVKPTAAVSGTVDTTNTALKSFAVTVSGGYATENYKFAVFPTTAEIEILGVDVKDGDYTVTPDNTKWQNSALTITPKGDYNQISTDKSNWKSTLSLDTEGADSSATFYLKNSTTGITTASKTIAYKLDKTNPDGNISFNSNTVKKILSTITFGLFFKENVDVVITSSDALSGVAKTEYYKSASILTELAVEGISSWTTYNNSFSITATDKDKFVVYVKVTDTAGNVTYFGSDGTTFDTVAPTISVTDGKIYCAATTVTITDDNPDTVTLDGKAVTLNNGKFTVSPKSGVQTIIATDKAGNKTTVTITVNNGHTPNEDDGDCTTAIHCKYCDAITTDAKTHDFSGKYIADGVNGHYQKCQNKDCTKHNDTVVHTGEDDNNCETEHKCSTCNYVIKAAEIHDFTGALIHDGTYHWHSCTHSGCTVTDTKTAHDYSIKGTETPATYFADGKRVDTCICGATNTVVLPKLVDTTAPTADITIKGNSVKQIANTLTFGIFFKETQTVTVTADDKNESGVDKTCYYLANSETTDFTGVSWTEFEGSFSINPNNKYVVYVKVTDKVGNETIINSDGIVLENIVPQITAENGKTYCAVAEVTAVDDNLDTVTLDGKAVTLTDGKFTISSKSGVQTIIATDKAGNKTTVTITVNSAHTWDDGVVTTKPTASSEGVKTYTCTVCGETKTESIAKLAPTIVEGEGCKFTQGGKDGLIFKSDAALSDFVSVLVDGNVIGTDKYTTSEGSTIVTLKSEYLESLSAGKHTLDIKSVSGTASTEFMIELKVADTSKPEDTQPPQTGDTNDLIIWFALLFTSGGTLTMFGILKKRRKVNSK